MVPFLCTLTMCKFCAPILGYTRPHDESNCALKQATVCPHCGPCTHFPKDCPKRSKPLPRGFQAIPSTAPSDPPQIYRLADSNQAYVEYLKLYKLEKQEQPTLEKNRKVVEAHLQKRGYILQVPLEPPTMVEKSQTVCKQAHAGNETCVQPLVNSPHAGTQKKRILKNKV